MVARVHSSWAPTPRLEVDPEFGEPLASHSATYTSAKIALTMFVGVAAVLEGTTLTENDIAAALAPLQDEIEPLDDTQTTAAYRRRVAPRMLRRAIQDAVAEASA